MSSPDSDDAGGNSEPSSDIPFSSIGQNTSSVPTPSEEPISSDTNKPIHTPSTPIHRNPSEAMSIPTQSEPSPSVFHATKPRSNSQLHSTRPAPPSPNPSRPPSQILHHSPLVPSSPGRNRSASQDSSSTGSSIPDPRRSSGNFSSGLGINTLGGGNDIMGSLPGRRNSSKPRPRSSLGTSSLLPEEHSGLSNIDILAGQEGSHSSFSTGNESLATSAIPENESDSQIDLTQSPISAFTSSTSSKTSTSTTTPTPTSPKEASYPPTSEIHLPPMTSTITTTIEIIIRDFAFPETDDRFKGIYPPLPTPTEDTGSEYGGGGGSGSNTQWSSSGGPSGWGGFGLLGWRGFGGRSKTNSGISNKSNSGKVGDEDDQDEDDEFGENDDSGYALPVPDHTDDDYAFSSGSEDETTVRYIKPKTEMKFKGKGRNPGTSRIEIEGGSSEGSASDDEDDDDEEGDEPWGWYRAEYNFQALGENEMDLVEGDLVYVRGRGVGEGWVVAVRGGKGSPEEGESGQEIEGLVPETYLEKVDL